MVLISLRCNKINWLYKCTPAFSHKNLNLSHLEPLHNNLFKNITNVFCLKLLALFPGGKKNYSGSYTKSSKALLVCSLKKLKKHELKYLNSLHSNARFCLSCYILRKGKDFNTNCCFSVIYFRSH